MVTIPAVSLPGTQIRMVIGHDKKYLFVFCNRNAIIDARVGAVSSSDN